MFKSKKAQTGETISWIVATIIIFVIIMFFIFGASLLGGTKQIALYKNKLFTPSGEYSFNYHYQKSIYTYTQLGEENSDLKSKIKTYFNNTGYPFDENYRDLREAMAG